jgi:predicted nucleic acid-binding protein
LADQRLFLDTNSLVKLYVKEGGSDRVVALVSQAREVVVSALAELEFLSAIGRKKYFGEMTATQYEELIASFYTDWSEIYVQQPLSEAVYSNARSLLRSYRLRTLDSLQLSSASVFSSNARERPVFVTFDLVLADVARREGFEAWPG